jgi:hypothetical protein
MEVFDDNEIYRNLDAMVSREVQDFMQALPYNPSTENPAYVAPANARYFLQATFVMIADPEPLTVFDRFMTECANDATSPMHAKYGWSLVNGSYSQTGLLRRYVHLWASHQPLPDAAGGIAWLSAQPAVAKALNQPGSGNPQWEVWEPVSYQE